jgi:hypothetical protein
MINATLPVWPLHTFAALLGIEAELIPVVVMMAMVPVLVIVVMWLVVPFPGGSAAVARPAM